jgi:hypothetical protein
MAQIFCSNCNSNSTGGDPCTRSARSKMHRFGAVEAASDFLIMHFGFVYLLRMTSTGQGTGTVTGLQCAGSNRAHFDVTGWYFLVPATPDACPALSLSPTRARWAAAQMPPGLGFPAAAAAAPAPRSSVYRRTRWPHCSVAGSSTGPRRVQSSESSPGGDRATGQSESITRHRLYAITMTLRRGNDAPRWRRAGVMVPVTRHRPPATSTVPVTARRLGQNTRRTDGRHWQPPAT